MTRFSFVLLWFQIMDFHWGTFRTAIGTGLMLCWATLAAAKITLECGVGYPLQNYVVAYEKTTIVVRNLIGMSNC